VKGVLTLKQDHMTFSTKNSEHNFLIDYLDIVAATKILIPN
jgi:hypothetical protein